MINARTVTLAFVFIQSFVKFPNEDTRACTASVIDLHKGQQNPVKLSELVSKDPACINAVMRMLKAKHVKHPGGKQFEAFRALVSVLLVLEVQKEAKMPASAVSSLLLDLCKKASLIMRVPHKNDRNGTEYLTPEL